MHRGSDALRFATEAAREAGGDPDPFGDAAAAAAAPDRCPPAPRKATLATIVEDKSTLWEMLCKTTGFKGMCAMGHYALFARTTADCCGRTALINVIIEPTFHVSARMDTMLNNAVQFEDLKMLQRHLQDCLDDACDRWEANSENETQPPTYPITLLQICGFNCTLSGPQLIEGSLVDGI